MKKLIALVLCLVCLCTVAVAEMPAEWLKMSETELLDAMFGYSVEDAIASFTAEELEQLSEIAVKFASAFTKLAELSDAKIAELTAPDWANMPFPDCLKPMADEITQYNQTVREVKFAKGVVTIVVDVENGWMSRSNTITNTIRFMCDFCAKAFTHDKAKTVVAEFMTEGVNDYGHSVDLMIITYTLKRATAEKMNLEYMSYSAAAGHAPFLRVVDDYGMIADYMQAIKR